MWGVAPFVFAGEFRGWVCVSGRMLSRTALCLVVLGATGCVSLRDATLISTQVSVERFNAPVKCGPVGFRRVPLEARFGEYVRVTVASPVPLKGTAFIHADGVAQEPREWVSSAENPLVIEARFENADPDRLVLLNADRPIDLTITGLEAVEGGSCEGAVFTLEHGRLVPPVAERAWLAELERRGGPALLARREAEAKLMEERRQAHYAEWAAKDLNDVSEEELALMEARRLAHYAAWEAERRPPEVVEEESDVAVASADEWNAYAPGHAGSESAVVSAVSPVPAASVIVEAHCASGVCDSSSPSELMLPPGCESLRCAVQASACGGACTPASTIGLGGAVAAAGASNGCPGGVCGEDASSMQVALGAESSNGLAMPASVSSLERSLALPVGCGSMSCAVPAASCGGDCTPASVACPGGVCGELALPVGCGSMACAVPAVACSGGCTPARVACPGGVCAELMMPPGCSSSACAVPATVCRGACTPCAGAGVNESWASYPPASGGGGNVAAGGVAGTADEWAMPQTAEVAWEQPYPVATETRVVTPAPVPAPCASCAADAEVDVALDLGFFLPAMFGLVFGAPPPPPVRVVGPPPGRVVGPPPPRPHGAAPVR